MRINYRYFLLSLLTITTISCTPDHKVAKDVLDPDIGMSRKEFEDNIQPPPRKKLASAATKNEPPLPDLSQILVTPKPPAMAKNKLVSLTITEAVPLKEVLIELAREADLDIELDPNISGGIILKVKDKPLDQVVDRISQLAGLRYSYENNILKVEKDTPYIVDYNVDFLNIVRSSNSTVTSNTTIGSSGGGGGGGSSVSGAASSGAKSSMTATYDGDLWKSVESDIKKILGYDRVNSSVANSEGIEATLPPRPAPVAPVVAPVAAIPPAAPVSPGSNVMAPTSNAPMRVTPQGLVPVEMPSNQAAASGANPTGQAAPTSANPYGVTVPAMSPPSAVIPAAPAFQTASNASGNGAKSGGGGSGSGGGASSSGAAGDTGPVTYFITVNKQANIISVLGTSRQQADVKKYLDRVKSTMSAQVLIEAKLVEITLNDQFSTGVNWDLVEKKLGVGINGNFTSNITPLNGQIFSFGVLNSTGKSATAPNGSGITNGGVSSGTVTNPLNINDAVQLVDQFGTVRTLDSPRINAMNNQQAMLSFVTNQIYFTVTVTQGTPVVSGGTTIPGQTTVTSTLNTVPIGFILNLEPTINLDTNEVLMNIRPTLSRIVSYTQDPAVQYIAETAHVNITNQIPIVDVRELDSILKIKSGQVMVIGGLMEDVDSTSETGVPYVQDIPYFGNLVKSVSKTKNLVQTIIFIKATIVPPTNNATKSDKETYTKFTRDPNPLAF